MKAPLLAIATLLLTAACATQPRSAQQSAPPLLVPSSGSLQPTPVALTLASEEDADMLFPRGERFAIGPQYLYEATAYTDYTFDEQNISTPHSSGYKYRWIVTSGLSFSDPR